MYETYNFLANYLKKKKNIKNLEENYKKILTCFNPVIPHFNIECLNELEGNLNIKWPEFDESSLLKEKVNIVIQINGKKRAVLNKKKGITKKELLELIKKDKSVEKYIINKDFKKIIYVENRLMNILIDE